MLQTISLQPPINEHQRSVNDFWHCIIENREGFAATLTHSWTIARLRRQNIVGTTSGLCPKHERQRSVNNFWPCIIENARAVWRHWTIIKLSATFLHKNGCEYIATMSYKCASMERQRLLALHLGKCKGCVATLTHNRTIGRLSRQKCLQQNCNHVPIWASTEHQWFLILHLG